MSNRQLTRTGFDLRHKFREKKSGATRTRTLFQPGKALGEETLARSILRRLIKSRCRQDEKLVSPA